MKKTVEDFMALPYSMTVKSEPENSFFIASVNELPGCSGYGQTPEKAIHSLRENMSAWFSSCLKTNTPIPIPSVAEDLPSGKFLLRVPKTIHLALIEVSKKEDVSLNQLAVAVLSRYVGYQAGRMETAPAQPDEPKTLDPWSTPAHAYVTTWHMPKMTPEPNSCALETLFIESLAKKATTSTNIKFVGGENGKEQKHSGWN